MNKLAWLVIIVVTIIGIAGILISRQMVRYFGLNKGILYKSRNKYGPLLVTESHGKRCVTSGRTTFKKGCMLLKEPNKVLFRCLKSFLSTLLLNPNPKRVLMVGLGTGTVPKALQILTPKTRVTSVEINAEFSLISRKYFGYIPSEMHDIIIEDGVEYIKNSSNGFYDIIMIDAFDSASCPPDTFVSENFMSSAKKALTKNGIIVMNTLTVCKTYTLIPLLFQKVFGQYHRLETSMRNRVFIAKNGRWPTYDEIKATSKNWTERMATVGMNASDLAFSYKNSPNAK